MPYIITEAQEPAVSRSQWGRYVVEASCLELPPGRFPKAIVYHGVEYSYYKTDVSDGGEDVAGVIYRHGGGAMPMTELLVIND